MIVSCKIFCSIKSHYYATYLINLKKKNIVLKRSNKMNTYAYFSRSYRIKKDYL